MRQFSHLKRPAVIVLVGAGWLSVLGNSPGDMVNLVPDGTSGAITLTLLEQRDVGSGCRVGVRLSRPVLRATLHDDAGVIGSLSCYDGSDCLSEIRFPPESTCSGGRAATVPATGAADAPPLIPDAANPARDATVTDAPASTDSTVVARDGSAEVAPVTDAAAVVDATGDLPAPTPPSAPADAGAGGTCWTGAVPPVRIRFDGQLDYQRCNQDGKRFKLTVETTDGASATLDYHIEVEKPAGYFGCGC